MDDLRNRFKKHVFVSNHHPIYVVSGEQIIFESTKHEISYGFALTGHQIHSAVHICNRHCARHLAIAINKTTKPAAG